jgi:hypothetical protein
MSLADIASGIASLAALVTVYYARATVGEARAARSESAQAHGEEMDREAQLLQATTTAHEQEMGERRHALERELWLERLRQLGKLQDLLWEAADVGRHEIEAPPQQIAGQPGSWTRLTGVLLRLEAAVVSLELIDGPDLAKVRQMAIECRQIRTPPGKVVSETMSALQVTLHLAENDPKFRPPQS